MLHIHDQIFSWPDSLDGDAITVKADTALIERCVFDFRAVPRHMQDEVVSGVCGARVTMRGCVILGGIKAILAGNGDYPQEDRTAQWLMEDCVLLGAGRRCPEVQDWVTLSMKRCWVHNWGEAFDVRAFGAWAHRGGRIAAEDCLFTQSGGLMSLGWWNTAADLANHVGQAVNDGGFRALLRPRAWLPGVCRGLTADDGGTVEARNCWRNRPWIVLEGCDSYQGLSEAMITVMRIEEVCPDMRPYLGKRLVDVFAREGR